ncbi:hypothetical protein [Cardinium endosymbiont of Sogatella furcifera]|uniref:hypothetical protein n=1 Tax=Cardinium endosymbiont of Sogatella furcifera TaxID=650378 RepID=UPI000E0D2652|nr:hypothetical protein [Cardinium endosymbiont of Sogatella furcifera]
MQKPILNRCLFASFTALMVADKKTWRFSKLVVFRRTVVQWIRKTVSLEASKGDEFCFSHCTTDRFITFTACQLFIGDHEVAWATAYANESFSSLC